MELIERRVGVDGIWMEIWKLGTGEVQGVISAPSPEILARAREALERNGAEAKWVYRVRGH